MSRVPWPYLGHGLRGNNKQKLFAVLLRFLWEHIHNKNIGFAKIATSDQLSDALTKQLPGPAFIEFRNQIKILPRIKNPVKDFCWWDLGGVCSSLTSQSDRKNKCKSSFLTGGSFKEPSVSKHKINTSFVAIA